MCHLNVREIKYNECLSKQVAITIQSSTEQKEPTHGEQDTTFPLIYQWQEILD